MYIYNHEYDNSYYNSIIVIIINTLLRTSIHNKHMLSYRGKIAPDPPEELREACAFYDAVRRDVRRCAPGLVSASASWAERAPKSRGHFFGSLEGRGRIRRHPTWTHGLARARTCLHAGAHAPARAHVGARAFAGHVCTIYWLAASGGRRGA